MSDSNSSSDFDIKSVDQAALREIRSRHPHVDEIALIRYLLTNNTVGDASRELSSTLDWRNSYLPITTTLIMNEFKTGKFYFYGHDADGHPLLVFDAAKHNSNNRNKDNCVKALVFLIESIYLKLAINFEKAKRKGKRISKFSILINRTDMKGSSDMELLREFAAIVNKHYPMCLHKVYIYPTPFIIKTMWQVAKNFLPSEASNVFRPKMTLSALRVVIPDKYIPVNMGGSSSFKFDINKFPSPFETSEYDFYQHNIESLELLVSHHHVSHDISTTKNQYQGKQHNEIRFDDLSNYKEGTNVDPNSDDDVPTISGTNYRKVPPSGPPHYSPSSITTNGSNSGKTWSRAQRK